MMSSRIVVFSFGTLVLLGLGFVAGRMGMPVPASETGAHLARRESFVGKADLKAVVVPHQNALSVDQESDISELVAVLDRFPSSSHRQAYLSAMLREWAKQNSGAALAYARSQGGDELLVAAYQGWAEGDPLAAWESAQGVGPRAIAAVLEAVGESSPENLEPFLGEMDVTLDLNDPDPLGPIFVTGVRAMVGKGLTDEAIRVSSRVQEPEFRRDSFKSIVLGLLEDEVGEEEATEVLLSFPTEEDRSIAAGAVGRLIAKESPDGAAAWAATLPEGTETRKNALFQSVTEWFERDFFSATDWMNENMADPDFDVLVSHVALNERMVYHSPAISMEWVESIHDANTRFESIVEVASEWANDAPEKAMQAIASSTVLTPQEKELAYLQVEERVAAP